jgi:hypothetical protein
MKLVDFLYKIFFGIATFDLITHLKKLNKKIKKKYKLWAFENSKFSKFKVYEKYHNENNSILLEKYNTT